MSGVMSDVMLDDMSDIMSAVMSDVISDVMSDVIGCIRLGAFTWVHSLGSFCTLKCKVLLHFK